MPVKCSERKHYGNQNRDWGGLHEYKRDVIQVIRKENPDVHVIFNHFVQLIDQVAGNIKEDEGQKTEKKTGR